MSRIPLANARGSEALILSRDRQGAVVKLAAIVVHGDLWPRVEAAGQRSPAGSSNG